MTGLCDQVFILVTTEPETGDDDRVKIVGVYFSKEKAESDREKISRGLPLEVTTEVITMEIIK